MFELYHLPGNAQLPSQLARTGDDRRCYLIHGDAFPPQPMILARQLLSQASVYLSEAEQNALSLKHDVLLRLIHGKLSDTLSLTKEQQTKLRKLTARLESNLTHNTALGANLIEECAQLFHALLGTDPICIAISDYSRLDDISMRLLHEMIKRRRQLNIHWIVGLPQEYRQQPSMGLIGDPDIWIKPLSIHRASLRALKECIAFQEHSLSADAISNDADPLWDNLVLASDDIAWDEQATFVLFPHTVSYDNDWLILYNAACHAFQLFAFTSAAFFAHHSLSLGRGLLTAQQRAVLHGIYALAAQNRQFSSALRGDIIKHILNQLNQAIALETRGTVRCAHWYRLAMIEARHFQRYEQALAHVSSGFSEIGRGHLNRTESLLAEAWLYSIKAYSLLHLHQTGEAEAAIHTSYQILQSADLTGTGLDDEARLSLAVIVENTMQLMRITAQTDKWQQLLNTSEQLSSRWPMFSAANCAEKADLAIYELDLKSAIEHAKKGIEESIIQCNIAQRFYFTTMLGELLMRACCWRASWQTFMAALALPGRPEDGRQSINTLPIVISCVRAMIRDHQIDRADTLLKRCQAQMAQLKDLSSDDQIHFLCLQAAIALHQRQEAQAEDNLQQLVRIASDPASSFKLALVNAFIVWLSDLRGDQQTASSSAKNAWQHCQYLLANQELVQTEQHPMLMEAILKTFMHPSLLDQHRYDDWQQVLTLVARSLRHHCAIWLYLEALIKAAQQCSNWQRLKEQIAAQSLLRALKSQQTCRKAFANYQLDATHSAESNDDTHLLPQSH